MGVVRLGGGKKSPPFQILDPPLRLMNRQISWRKFRQPQWTQNRHRHHREQIRKATLSSASCLLAYVHVKTPSFQNPCNFILSYIYRMHQSITRAKHCPLPTRRLDQPTKQTDRQKFLPPDSLVWNSSQ